MVLAASGGARDGSGFIGAGAGAGTGFEERMQKLILVPVCKCSSVQLSLER